MDEIVGALRQEGTSDSNGVFTLDLLKSAQKLQSFRLPSGYHYVLPMVGSAVLGGASSVSYLQSLDHNTLEIAGLAFDLSQCQAALAQPAGQDAAGYLALAIQTALRLQLRYRVQAVTWNGESGVIIQSRKGKLEATPLLTPPWDEQQKRTRLVLAARFPGNNLLDLCWRKLAGWPPARDPALELLQAYCCYSPVSIHTTARTLTLERQGRWSRLGVINAAQIPRKRPGSGIELNADVPFCGYLGWGPAGGGLLVIVDGLLYTVNLSSEIPEGETFRGILWHQNLPRDLSLLNLVQGPALQELEAQILSLLQRI